MPRRLSHFRLAKKIAPLLLALTLGGCFLTKEPLITPDTAAYPIESGSHFDAFARRGADWRPLPEGRSVYRRGDYYVYVNDDSDRTSVPFLLMEIAPGHYIVQANDTSNFDRVSEYYYFLVEFDGVEAIQYSSSCRPRQEWIDGGVVTQVERTSINTRCHFADIAGLTTALEEVSEYTAPEEKYVLTTTGGEFASPN
jgi:hypothetical protein